MLLIILAVLVFGWLLSLACLSLKVDGAFLDLLKHLQCIRVMVILFQNIFQLRIFVILLTNVVEESDHAFALAVLEMICL